MRHGSVRSGRSRYSRLAEALRRQSFQGPRDLLGLTADDITRSLDIDLDVAASYVRRLARAGQLAFELDRLRSRGVWVVTDRRRAVPARVLRERLGSGAPPVLFGSGPPELLMTGGIAIVGSREADAEATSRSQSGWLAPPRAGGATVISGGARGIDAVAMRAAFQAGGSVIGVVPEGVERRLREASTQIRGGGWSGRPRVSLPSGGSLQCRCRDGPQQVDLRARGRGGRGQQCRWLGRNVDGRGRGDRVVDGCRCWCAMSRAHRQGTGR